MARATGRPDAVIQVQTVPLHHRVRVGLVVLRRAPMVPMIILGVLLIFVVFAPLIATHDPVQNDIMNNLAPPSLANILGTDQLGRDVYSRIIYGSRISLALSLLVIAIGGGTGIIFGTISGYMGGRADALVQRGVEAVLALPLILVALSFVFTFGFSFWNVVLILCPFVAARFARIVRGETLSVRERDYVALARVIGAPTHRIVLKHILPNVFNTVVVISTLEVGHIILVESSLSFLGVGIPPPKPAWGLMVSEGRQFITSAYWITLFPGLAILATVLSLNLFGDWLRDTMDPRRREL
ncbi:MAG TPA: ABC transporter permease [Dehalococcoidia bacterium]|nr:ABC transporter permease [Dehalococcoidia bacterium]